MREYEKGLMSRRQLVGNVAALLAAAAAPALAGQQETGPGLFPPANVNHVTLRVSNVRRSREFYERLLGARVLQGPGGAAFLSAGDKVFIYLAESPDKPGIDHFCFGVDSFKIESAAEKLRSNSLAAEVVSGRELYTRDPDGIKVQLATPDYKNTSDFTGGASASEE